MDEDLADILTYFHEATTELPETEQTKAATLELGVYNWREYFHSNERGYRFHGDVKGLVRTAGNTVRQDMGTALVRLSTHAETFLRTDKKLYTLNIHTVFCTTGNWLPGLTMPVKVTPRFLLDFAGYIRWVGKEKELQRQLGTGNRSSRRYCLANYPKGQLTKQDLENAFYFNWWPTEVAYGS